MIELPFSFGDCAGWLHLPADHQRRTAVVLCPPFGHEWLWSYRTYRHLTRALVDAGFPVLRFDYRGTGDSLGDESEAGQLRQWIDSIHAACDAAKRLTGADDVALFGLRLGGTLATVASGERDDVRSLVVWAPFASLKSFVREARAFALLRSEANDEPLQVAGFAVPPDLLTPQSQLDVTRTTPHVGRALVLQRDDLAADPTFTALFEGQGIPTTTRVVPGYTTMMRDPWQAEVPEVAIADIVAFLVAGHPERDRSVRRLPPATPLATDAFVETPYIFGSSARLFGVLTAPTGHAGVGRPVVLLPNVGSNHHIGPNRMMVTLARRLASAGFRVFRFDIAGIGDGHPVPGQAENRLYSPASVADAQAAITFLGEAAGTDRVAFVGLCSGAYLAYHTAAVDPRVQEQVLINLQTFLWREGDSLELALRGSYRSSLYYRSALGRRESWRRLVRGEINVRGIVGVTVRRVAGRVAASLKQLVSADARRVARQFREVARRGGGSFLIYSSEDGGIDEMERQLGSAASRAAGLPKFKLALIEHADHTFTQASARHQLIDTLVSHLTQRYPVAAP